MDTSEVLDLSKENFQPLVHGRRQEKLSTVLQVNDNFHLQQQLRKEREEFEERIQKYEGDDPLEIRYEYVEWLEQSYPCLGAQTNILPFLEETLSAYKNDERYKQDPRYISLVIKYISAQPNPLEIYNLVYSEGIGTKVAIFYKAWAEELDKNGSVKQANHVFELGLNAQAEPIEELEAAQMEFQLLVGRRFLQHGSMEHDGNQSVTRESERQVLGKLKKVTPGMTRLVTPGQLTMKQCSLSKPKENVKPAGLKVYMDPRDEENIYVNGPSMQNSHFKVRSDLIHKENSEKPSKWTKKKTKVNANPIPIHPSTPSFPIHVDQPSGDSPNPKQSQHQAALLSSALKPKKIEVYQTPKSGAKLFETCSSRERSSVKNKVVSAPKQPSPNKDPIPVCVLEPVDNTKKPMYRKSQIYVGDNRELQLEELRAQFYRKNRTKTVPQPSVEEEIPVCVPCYSEKTKPMYRKCQIYIGNNKEVQLEEIRASIYQTNKSNQQSRSSCSLKLESAPTSFSSSSEQTAFPSSLNKSSNSCSRVQNDSSKHSKALRFSSDGDDSVGNDSNERRQVSSGKKLGLFEESNKEISTCFVSETLDEACRNVLNDMWNSPSVNKNQDNLTDTSEEEPLNQNRFSKIKDSSDWKTHHILETIKENDCAENKADVSGITMNYTVNTKEAMKLVQEMWNSPSQGTPSKSNEDLTFKKPVSIKKYTPSRDKPRFSVYSDESTTPDKVFKQAAGSPKFNIFNDENGTPEKPIAKTPKFEIFTDENNLEEIQPKSVSKTPKFQIFNDDSTPEKLPKSTAKTPSFKIYSDNISEEAPIAQFNIFKEHEINEEKLSSVTCPKSLSKSPHASVVVPFHRPKTPFTIFCDEDANPKGNSPGQKKPQALNFDNLSDKDGNIEYEEMTSPQMERSVKLSLQNCAAHSDPENILPVEMYDNPVQPLYRGLETIRLQTEGVHVFCDEDDEDLARPLEEEVEPRPPQNMVLPFVPPKSSLDDEQLGHELKENFPPGDLIKEKSSRPLNGYLVPSSVYVDREEEEDKDVEFEATEVTMTRAFYFSLPSSTPFGNGRSKSSSYTPGNNVNGSFLQEPLTENQTQNYKTPNETRDLSVILEASKERSTSSSASSGSSVAPSYFYEKTERQLTTTTSSYKHTAVSELEESVGDLAIDKIDPFDEKLINDLLIQQVQFPLARHRLGYECFFSEHAPLKVNSHIRFGNTGYDISQELGKGAYARVLMGRRSCDQKLVALKQQRPACVWEWYICKEIENRLKNTNLVKAIASFAIPSNIYLFKNSSVLVSDMAKYGNLLDLINLFKFKMNKPLNGSVALKLNLEMARAVHALHKIQIIHGDIKPDNFVVCNLLQSEGPCLKLIDFGRGIDMSLFPPNTSFTTVVTTDGFQCNEMKEGKRWNYHTDLYGLASSMVCTLMGKYMKTIKKDSKWILADTIPRYLDKSLWTGTFEKLLNVPTQYDLTILEDIIQTFERKEISRDEMKIVDSLLMTMK